MSTCGIIWHQDSRPERVAGRAVRTPCGFGLRPLMQIVCVRGVVTMAQDKKARLPAGLPNRFADPANGFQQLCKFLNINRSQRQELLDSKEVQETVHHLKASVARRRTAERQRVLLTAFYENPDSRRDIWRSTLNPPQEISAGASTSVLQPPSIEFSALAGYDPEFSERDVDEAAVEEALRDLPDIVESITDAPAWQRPALAAWPTVHRDIAGWHDLPDDRRDAVVLALFAVATVLDDLRFLRWAAREVDALHAEFAALLDDCGAEAPAHDDDAVIRDWNETCDKIADAARTLGGDPPQPERLPDLSRHVRTLDSLRERVEAVLADRSPEKLLQRVDNLLAELADAHRESPIAQCSRQIAEQWRQAYPPDANPDVEALRADVERLSGSLEDALDNWLTKRQRKIDLDARLDEIKRRAESAGNPAARIKAENEEERLQRDLTSATTELRSARDQVFAAVAPGDEAFDPNNDYLLPSENGLAEAKEQATEEQANIAQTTDAQNAQTTDAQPSEEQPSGEHATEEQPSGEYANGKQPTEEQTTEEQATTDEQATEEQTTGHQATEEQATEEQATEEADPPDEEAIWMALERGRPGIAYHIARLRPDDDQPGTTPLADLLAATMLAPHVRSPEGDVVQAINQIMARVESTELPLEGDFRDAISLLLFSAALIPALFAPSTGAASLLRRVKLSERLTPVYRLASKVVDHSERLQGIRLDASLFRATLSGTWDEEFVSLAGHIADWRQRAVSKRNVYGRADEVWRSLLADDGRVGQLLALLSESNDRSRRRVKDILKEIGVQKAFSSIVRRTDGRTRKGDPIEGLALKQMWHDVQPALELSRKWLSMMDTKPDAGGFVSKRIIALRNDILGTCASARTALAGTPPTDSDTRHLVATRKVATRAIDDLRQLFDHAFRPTTANLAPEVIKSRDLLYIVNLDLNTKFNPVGTTPFRLRELLTDTDVPAATMRDAFDARLERGDFVGARLALDFIEAEEPPDAVELQVTLDTGINKRRKELRRELRLAQERLERAFCRGQLQVDDRDQMHAELTILRQVVEPSSKKSLRPPDVAVLAGSSRVLHGIDKRINASSKKSIEAVRNRLRKLRLGPDDADARSVDRMITEGLVQTADEQINRLERGEAVSPPPVANDPFSEFTQAVGAIEAARKTTDVTAIIKAVEQRERVAGISFNNLSDDAAQSTKDLLNAWYGLARKRSLDKNLLRELLRRLEFGVRTIQPSQPSRLGSQANVTTEPIEDRRVCPSRQFGSEANGRYRVVLVWGREPADQVFRLLGADGGAPVLALYFGCLGDDRDELRKRATMEHRLFLTVDESLVLFLAGRQSGWLSTLFRCTLPYSCAQPYATTSGLVPRELFYGRDRERDAIMDQSGACFLYGGRQLGKTALLRHVEHYFNRSEEEGHVAKWIDLKVNEIDRAPDIWRVLQRELQRPLGLRRDREIDSESAKQVESLLDEIRRWLDGRGSRRLLLLLDEADHFLDVDERTDFRESTSLKGLMDETNRRFKVVFAGLHNVLRTTQQANHPLAHLGNPVCVGAMLSNGEWAQAHALVREPLRAVGVRFRRDDLSTLILAHTNYYPSLIQLYGAEIVRRLREIEKPFPYEIEDSDIDEAYTGRELGDAIRERFLLTLQLDPRYEVIAYAMAHELKEGADLHRGLDRAKVHESARYWWDDGFQLRESAFHMLLQEMEGLGVLRAVEPSRYTLRNPNILLLLGDVEGELIKERELPPKNVYAPSSFRAPYPKEPAASPKRGPLTRQQESCLRTGGVAVICGCKAAGLEDVPEFLSQRVGRGEFSRIRPAASATAFEQQLLKLRPTRNTVTLRLVPSTVNWDVEWLRIAKRVLDKKAQGKRLWNRVAFIATPEVLWRLLAEADESDLDRVDWCGLGPCDLTFLRRWLEDTNAAADADKAEDFLRTSGGWLDMLDRFSRRTRKPWQTRIEELQRELAQDPAKRLREQFGLAPEMDGVCRVLVGADDPFDEESIELASSEVGWSTEETRRCVQWAEHLGLLSRAGDDSWTFNPLVRDLIEKSEPAR